MIRRVAQESAQAAERARERLSERTSWFPFPALLVFLLALILTGHLLPGLNPRIGSRIDVLQFAAPSQKEGSLWLGVFPEGDSLVVITGDRKRFSWPEKSGAGPELEKLRSYLRGRAEREIIASGLRQEADATRLRVVLAVDQNLDYRHLRSIIGALADARFTRYGFETLNPM